MNQRELHTYGPDFYRYQREGSLRSAREVLSVLLRYISVRSVLDVGCGAGAWLSAYREQCVDDYIGLDGDYVDRSVLLISESRFCPQDITRCFDLGRQFDIVQCLEVAEHIPPRCSETLVDNIVRHGKRVLFSAGVPGQGGEDHINEQPLEYWRKLFSERGYGLFDFLRPRISTFQAVEHWYRYNLLFFVHVSLMDELPTEVKSARIAEGQFIPDLSPVGYQLQKAVLRRFPVRIVTSLARWKHKRALRALTRTGT